MLKTRLGMAAAIAVAVMAGTAHATDQFVGEIRTFGFPHCPNGWLHANGQTVTTAHYPELFSVIGHYYGGSGGYFVLPHNTQVDSANGKTEIACIAATGRYSRPVKVH